MKCENLASGHLLPLHCTEQEFVLHMYYKLSEVLQTLWAKFSVFLHFTPCSNSITCIINLL